MTGFFNNNNIDQLGIQNNKSFRRFNSNNAIAYARKYALEYNSNYIDFNDMGGDCTNFISQCLYAGGIPLSSTWTPYSNTWLRVNELRNYLINNGYAKELSMDKPFKEGNIIQFFSNTKGYYSHSGIITKVIPDFDYLYCCHSYDKLDYPLSFIYPSLYTKFRVLDIV